MFDRRSLIKSAAGSMAGAFLAPAFASSVLSPDDKLMPVDTRNGRSGWAKPVKQVIQIKNCRIGEGTPKVIASTTAKTPESFLKLMKEYAEMP